MTLALDEARLALDHDDVPVGAVVLRDGDVLARRHNERERPPTRRPTPSCSPCATPPAPSARWRLDDCTLVVTLEPCVMCAGAVVNARIGQLVYGATDPKAGAVGSLYDVPADARLNHRPPVVGGVLAAECGDLLRAFFSERRRPPVPDR